MLRHFLSFNICTLMQRKFMSSKSFKVGFFMNIKIGCYFHTLSRLHFEFLLCLLFHFAFCISTLYHFEFLLCLLFYFSFCILHFAFPHFVILNFSSVYSFILHFAFCISTLIILNFSSVCSFIPSLIHPPMSNMRLVIEKLKTQTQAFPLLVFFIGNLFSGKLNQTLFRSGWKIKKRNGRKSLLDGSDFQLNQTSKGLSIISWALWLHVQSGASSPAKHGGAYFSAVYGSIEDPVAAPGHCKSQVC